MYTSVKICFCSIQFVRTHYSWTKKIPCETNSTGTIDSGVHCGSLCSAHVDAVCSSTDKRGTRPCNKQEKTKKNGYVSKVCCGLLEILDGQSRCMHSKLQALEFHIDELGHIPFFQVTHVVYVLAGHHQVMMLGLRILVSDDHDELVRMQHASRVVHGQY